MTNTVKYITNAFSLQMLDTTKMFTVRVTPISSDDFEKVKNEIPSAVGHQDTANVLGIPMNRVNVHLEPGDSIIVVQLTGGRLPEGCTTLPDGFKFSYLLVQISNT